MYCPGEVYPRTESGKDEDSGWRPLAGHRQGPGARRTIVETGNIQLQLKPGRDRDRCGMVGGIFKKDQWSSIFTQVNKVRKLASIVSSEMLLPRLGYRCKQQRI